MNQVIAMTIAKIAHAGQEYGGGEDYFIRHVSDVAFRVANDSDATGDSIIVAYLHDTVEDTSVTLSDLSDLGFAPNIVAAIDAISRRDDESYFEYIARCGENKLAAFVKKHDLMSNTNADTPASLFHRNKKALELLS